MAKIKKTIATEGTTPPTTKAKPEKLVDKVAGRTFLDHWESGSTASAAYSVSSVDTDADGFSGSLRFHDGSSGMAEYYFSCYLFPFEEDNGNNAEREAEKAMDNLNSLCDLVNEFREDFKKAYDAWQMLRKVKGE